MAMQIQITGIAYEIDETTRKYIIKKIERLDRYLPKHARKSVSAEVKLEQVDHDHGDKYEVEIIINVPGKLITAKNSTDNMLTAFDATEVKIRSQFDEYKQAVIAHIGKRGIMSRFKRNSKRELL